MLKYGCNSQYTCQLANREDPDQTAFEEAV